MKKIVIEFLIVFLTLFLTRVVKFCLNIWLTFNLFGLYLYFFALAKGQIIYYYNGVTDNFNKFRNTSVTSFEFLSMLILLIFCRILLGCFMRKLEIYSFFSSWLHSLSPRARTVLKCISIIVVIFSIFGFAVFIMYGIEGSLETNPTEEDESGVLLVTSMISYLNLLIVILMTKILVKLSKIKNE